LKVISTHGGTKAANRAEFIAGATYLHLKEYDKAIKHLKNFKANGAHQVESKCYTMLGHAYAESNKTTEALEQYKKAANVNKKDETVTPEALFTAASYAETIGKTEDAIQLYKELKDNFPAYNAVRSGDVDKFLAALGELN
jgi:tetratricopeptide (TPR) repeat protein